MCGVCDIVVVDVACEVIRFSKEYDRDTEIDEFISGGVGRYF